MPLKNDAHNVDLVDTRTIQACLLIAQLGF